MSAFILRAFSLCSLCLCVRCRRETASPESVIISFSFVLNIIKEAGKVTDADGERYCSFFRKLIAGGKKLDDQDIDRFNTGDIRQLFEKSEKSSQKPLPSNFDVEALVRELELCTSREQGEAILERRCNLRRKKDFYDILTHLETAFNKREKIAVLKEKVIENTIGYRIRSQAIQNYGEAIK